MDYTYFDETYGSRPNEDFPIQGVNDSGEFCCVYRGQDDGGMFYQQHTYQSNNWIRVNTYYEDGTYCEEYKK